MKSAIESPLNDAAEMKINLPNKPSRVTLFLGYKEIEVDSEELYGSLPGSPRMAIFKYIGPEKLEELLRSDGDKLEKGVSILLHLLGLNVVQYGSLPGEIPDVIAISQVGRWVLVIECTGRELNRNDKLAKLVTRSKEIQDSLPEYQIHPIIVTSLERKMIGKGDIEKAESDRIIVVTNDDTSDLLQAAFDGISEDEVLSRLLRLLPTTGRDSFRNGFA
jgi:hypothetical protein